ncbi:spore germination protein (amino acid permease) [Alkalibacillus flavidus]|uniref:Spore germination protein (Amino acid permease) n=1 Tax=Alkalibacillus flavidus TaxID=546021 RepID=A0ABV2KVE4_9BACI
MQEKLNVPNHQKLKAIYLVIVLHTMQIGVGIAGYPRIVFIEVGRDSWIAILIAAATLHIAIACSVYVLNSFQSEDLHGILTQTFGKWFGKLFTLLFIAYIWLMFLSIMLNYVEFVQVFVFPDMTSWFIAACLLVLVLYAVQGGVRVAVGASVVFFFGAIWMLIILIQPIGMIQFDNYFPVFESSPQELLQGALKTSYSLIGFELIWVLYPFIRGRQHVHRYSQWAMAFTILMMMFITMISIGFYSSEQLKGKIWPLLSMIKVVSYPMFERFDIVTVALWMVIVLPNLILLAWMSSFSLKRIFGGQNKYYLYLICLIAFICQFHFDNRYYVNFFTDCVGKAGLFFGFVFPILMVPFAMYHRRKGAKQHAK